MADQKEHTTDELIQKCKNSIYRCLNLQELEMPHTGFAQAAKTYAETLQALLNVQVAEKATPEQGEQEDGKQD